MSEKKSNSISIEMSKGKQILFLITIFLTNIAVMGEMIFTPIIVNVYESFPDSPFMVNTLISSTAIMMVIASLIAPAMMKTMSKKTIMILGGVLFTIGGVFGATIDNLMYMLIMRCLYGIGIALVNVTAVSLIAEVYVDEEKRAGIMGYYNAFMALIGSVLSIVAGSLATSFWKNAYFTYASAIPMIIMIILFIPSIKTVQEEKTTEQVNATKESLGGKFWVMLFNFVLFNLAYSVLMFFTSTYVAENALGTSTLAGLINSVGTMGSFVFCLAFGFVFGKLRSNTAIPFYIAAVVCNVLLYLFPGRTLALIVCTVYGGTYGSVFSYAYAYGPSVVPVSRINDSVGIITASYSIAMFFTTYIVTMLMNVLNTDRVTPIFGFCAILCVIIAIVDIVHSVKNKNTGMQQSI